MHYLISLLTSAGMVAAFICIDEYSPLLALLCAFVGIALFWAFGYSANVIHRWSGRQPTRSNASDATYFMIAVGGFVLANRSFPDSDLFVTLVTLGIFILVGHAVAQLTFGTKELGGARDGPGT